MEETAEEGQADLTGSKVLVETYDPEPDSDAEEWAQRYGLTGEQLGITDATLSIEQANRHDAYKDRLRTIEIRARRKLNGVRGWRS